LTLSFTPPRYRGMAHSAGDRKKRIQRVRRLRGQLQGVERMLAEGKDCHDILQNVAACRRALNGRTREMMLAQIDHHLIANSEPNTVARESSAELRAIISSYLK